MDSERNDYSQPGFSTDERTPGPQPVPVEPPRANPPYPPYPAYPQRRRVSGWRILWGIFFGLSVLANVGLFLLLVGVIFVFAGAGGGYGATVLRDGPHSSRIAVVNIEGIIDESQADEVYRQLKSAREDPTIKGMIVRVNSPGGTISASDRIYRDIVNYRDERGQPVVAFMQGMAASGGYYASVACDEIIAEPTAITGSIGVVMSHFVFQELLQNKLGIQPVFLTKGQKKDWPSSFRTPTAEELAYIDERLLEPAYQRFVSVVKEGRRKVLSGDEVAKLADGGIYVGEQAVTVELVDKTGYLDDAIATVKTRAGIDKAQVIEYRRPLSVMDFLRAESKNKTNLLHLDRSTLSELATPQVLYLWHGY
ncbi:MAG: signal peptide peptidase SppA [Phycisphaerales bacterium]